MNIRSFTLPTWPILALIVFAYTWRGSLAADVKVLPLLSLPGQTADPSLSPDGRSVAFLWHPTDVNEWGIYIASTSSGKPILFASENEYGGPRSPAWSPDGKWIAFLRSESTEGAALFIKSRVTEEERFLGLVCNNPEIWSADGEALIAATPRDSAYNDPCELKVYPIRIGGQPRGLGVSGIFPALSRDGKTLAFVHNHEIRLLSLTSSDRPFGTERILVNDPSGVWNPIWNTKGSEILYVQAQDRSRIRCVDARVGSVPHDVGNVDGNVASLALAPNGELLAGIEFRDSSLWTIDLQTPDSRAVLLRRLPRKVGSVQVSPDGRKITFSVTEGRSSELYISSLDGKGPRRLLTTPYEVEQLSWSPNGSEIAFIAQSGYAQLEPSRLFVISSLRGSPRRLLDHFKDVYAATWSSDGTALFVAANSDGMDAIWQVKLADGSVTRIFDGAVRKVRASPDGRFIYVIRRPFILSRIGAHGGPEEQLATGVLQFAASGDEIYIERQDSNPPATEGLNLYRLEPVVGMEKFVAHVGFLASSLQLRGERLIYLERHDPPQERVVAVQLGISRRKS
jgi:Tol biopolymer transport system component